ncbi:putative zn 2cys6 transcription factor protein [Rosellinia necatrix]|uniref:Putative zn 2cys6 transcription factor protein n=1 Tax=Rosellinia necatrix TaxID=77044 RepID=A0A1S8A5U5_ROSNE|nr:putative zn 2cys6 transcription factor protein [Rosellinia necatrix]
MAAAAQAPKLGLATLSPPPPSSSLLSLAQQQQQQPGLAATRMSAPYGQACVNCAKAKCKCILLSSGPAGSGPGRGGAGSRAATCERCARLGRECKPSRSVRKRGGGGVGGVGSRGVAGSGSAAAAAAASGRGSNSSSSSNGGGGSRAAVSAASRAANLEQKLEDLVAILKAQAGAAPTRQQDAGGDRRGGRDRGDERTSATAAAAAAGAPSTGGGGGGGSGSSRIAPGGPTVVTPASTAGYVTTADSTPSPAPAPAPVQAQAQSAHLPPAPHLAEEALVFFRRHHLQSFPFVYLPPEMTAAQIQRERPYLWLNICAICCKSPIQQAALSRQVREELAHKILVTCERNIDMLLGCLAFLGWSMHLCFKPSMSAAMGMATSIVTDLRLDKPSQEDDPRIMNCFKSNDFVRIPHSTTRTMEERRATLGCYVFCSTGSAFLRGSTSMRWTSHMEDSLKILAANPEWEGDQMLVLMTRIRRLADSIFQTQGAGFSGCDGYVPSGPPANIYMKYFHQCLQTIKDQTPSSLKDNPLATSLILSAEVMIAEMPFCNPSCWSHAPETHADAQTARARHASTPPPLPLPPPPPAAALGLRAAPADVWRIEASYGTLQASTAFVEHFLGLGPADLVGLSFPALLNFFRAAQVLYRLRAVADELPHPVLVVVAGGGGWEGEGEGDEGCRGQSRIDLLAAVDLVAGRYADLPARYGFLSETDADGAEVTNFYVKCAKTFSATLPMWRAQFAQADAARAGATSTAATAAGADSGGGVGVSGGDGGVVDPEAGSQVAPAVMGGAGLNPNMAGGRVNYSGMTNFMVPDILPMDFSMDDAWCNEIWASWDPSILGPM